MRGNRAKRAGIWEKAREASRNLGESARSYGALRTLSSKFRCTLLATKKQVKKVHSKQQ